MNHYKRKKRWVLAAALAVCCYGAAGAQSRSASLPFRAFLKKDSLMKAPPFPPSFSPARPYSSQVSVMRLPPDYDTRCWGYFCKLEWATEQKLKIPLSFRLGDLEYEEHLEGKDR